VTILNDLAYRLTRQLAGHPLFNRYFESLEDFKSFAGLEAFELETFFSLTPQEIEKHFELLGERLFEVYNPPFIDVSEMLDFIEGELVLSSQQGDLSTGCNEIRARLKIIGNGIAKSYFYRTLDEIARMAEFANEPDHSPLQMHFDWLAMVVKYLKGTTADLPETNHLACHFAHWLSGLKSELLLFSAGEEREDRHARITLAHRRVHEQLIYILSFVDKNQYILGYSHLAKLYHTVLQLDQQIRSLQLLYKENEEVFFYEFIGKKSTEVQGAYYFVSIKVKQIIDIATYSSREKPRDIEALRDALCEIFEAEDLDCVVLLYDVQIAVFFKTKSEIVNLDIPAFMEKKVHRFIERYALNHNYQIKSSGIGLDLVGRYPEQKIEILKQLNNFKLKESFTYVTEREIDELYDLSIESMRISRLASQALSEDRLTIFYQPIFSHTGQCTQYVEALVRAPIGDEIFEAGKFIQYLEKEGRMGELDLLVLQHIRRDIPRLKTVVNKLSVNIYPSSFNDQKVIETLIQLASELRAHEIHLIVEITEHLFMQDLKHIERLAHEYGIVFAMDDFGSGYSNLLQLIGYSEKGLVNILKIDGSIVQKIDKDETVYKILQVIIQIAQILELEPVVMEYVFNERVHKKLSELSVPLCYQGFYLSKPLPLEQLIAFGSR
jgi:EAL domain-containing protein (putative c-di-GMP-specific phosphodiesterase class I)